MKNDEIKNTQTIYFNTIERAISNDKDTCLWFLYALCHASLNTVLDVSSEKSISKLKAMRFIESMFTVLIYCSFASYLFNTDLLYLAAAICGLIILFFYKQKIRSITAGLGSELIKIKFPQLDLKEQTLYLLCEKISEENKLFSLVDLINIREKNLLISWVVAAAIAFCLRNPEIDLAQRSLIIIVLFGAISLVLQFLTINLRFRKK